MLSEKVNLLMRLFFRLNCEELLILEADRLFSLSRTRVNRLMSDLTNLRNASSLPKEEVVSVDSLLQVYAASGMTRAGNGVIALINEEIQLIAQLGKDEVLRLWEQLQKTQTQKLLQQKRQQEQQETLELLANKINSEKEKNFENEANFQNTNDEQGKKKNEQNNEKKNETFREYLQRKQEPQEKNTQPADIPVSPSSLLSPQELASLQEIIIDGDENDEHEESEEYAENANGFLQNNDFQKTNEQNIIHTKKEKTQALGSAKKNLHELMGEELIITSSSSSSSIPPKKQLQEKAEKLQTEQELYQTQTNEQFTKQVIAENEKQNANLYKQNATQQKKEDFSIEKLLGVAEQPPRAKQSSVNQDNSLNGQLAIMTMEALPIPMLACDTRGEELFLNQDWQLFLKQKKDKLKTPILLEQAKKIMVRLAKANTLDSQNAMVVENFSAYSVAEKKFLPYNVFLKAIRMQISASEQKTIGYLFYIVRDAQEKENVSAVGKQEALAAKDSASYSGKTLPEIIKEKEKDVLLWAYHQAGENQSNAAMLLGIPRQTFSYKFNKYFQKQKESL